MPAGLIGNVNEYKFFVQDKLSHETILLGKCGTGSIDYIITEIIKAKPIARQGQQAMGIM